MSFQKPADILDLGNQRAAEEFPAGSALVSSEIRALLIPAVLKPLRALER
jgi:hypothetical protein